MSFDAIPIWALFVFTMAVVLFAMEFGYRVGRVVHHRGAAENESAVSVISGAILGLAAFMLAFTFAIVTERYDTKKGLVRDDANAIRIAWQRSEFLPEPERSEAVALLRRYLDLRLSFAQARRTDPDRLRAALAETRQIQDRLWAGAVANGRRDMNSDIGALYVEALNDMSRVNALRIAIGLQVRVPVELWFVLFGITFLSMLTMGYQTAICESARSKAQPILALAFAVVIVLIATLDRPNSGYLGVTQQPLADLRREMNATRETPSPSSP